MNLPVATAAYRHLCTQCTHRAGFGRNLERWEQGRTQRDERYRKPSPQTATLPKSSEEIERCVKSSFRIAASMGFKGDFRQWEDLLRIGD